MKTTKKIIIPARVDAKQKRAAAIPLSQLQAMMKKSTLKKSTPKKCK